MNHLPKAGGRIGGRHMSPPFAGLPIHTCCEAFMLPTPRPFSHQWFHNGLMLSTCLLCSQVAASAKPENLKIAEQCHHCTARPAKLLKREAGFDADPRTSPW
jgi:hypothetical protein